MEDESQKNRQLEHQKVMSPLSMFALVIHQTKPLSMTLQLKRSLDKSGHCWSDRCGKDDHGQSLDAFYDIQAGKITIDGVDTKAMSREEVHDAFSMVLQDTWLFEGTIRENLV